MRLNFLWRGILRSPEIIIGGSGDAPTNEDVIDEVEQTADEVDDVAELLAAHSIMSETRHTEILERLSECQTRMTELSTTATQAESPALQQILSEVLSIRAELTTMKSEAMATRADLNRLIPSPSEPPPETVLVSEGDTPPIVDVISAPPEEPEEIPSPSKPPRKTQVI